MLNSSFFQRVRDLEHLTPSEARIVDHMERVYPLLSLETVTTISERAQVGRATVVRFIQRIGYGSFSDFQKELRSELLLRLRTPQEKLLEKRDEKSDDESNLFLTHCEQATRNIKEAVTRIDYGELKKAAERIAGCPGKIYVTGHRISSALAVFFYYELDFMREGVVLCTDMNGVLPNIVSGITEADVLVAFYMSRYSRVTEHVGRWFADRGSDIILVTDREINPLSPMAAFQFVAPSEGAGIFDSRSATLVIMETLINLVAIELEDDLGERFEQKGKALNAFSTYTDWWRHQSRLEKEPKPRKATGKNK